MQPKQSILWHYGMAMVGKSLHMSLGQLKIRECQVTCGGLCNILASQQSSEQTFSPASILFSWISWFFFKRPAQILPQDRKINGSKGCTVFARVTQKGWWQTDRWRKVTVFLGLRRRGHRRPRPTECVLYAPLVAWWWPGCTRAR